MIKLFMFTEEITELELAIHALKASHVANSSPSNPDYLEKLDKILVYLQSK